MIPPLVRLPATELDHDAIDELARCVDRVGTGRTVVLGAQRSASGDVLDEFVIAAAVSAAGASAPIGIAATVGAGRAASVVAREAAAARLLGACDVLLLEGSPGACRDAAQVIEALFTEGLHTVTTASLSITDVPSLPVPGGGPPVCWREGGELLARAGGEVGIVGTAVDVGADVRLPRPTPGVLVVVAHGPAAPVALGAALAR